MKKTKKKTTLQITVQTSNSIGSSHVRPLGKLKDSKTDIAIFSPSSD